MRLDVRHLAFGPDVFALAWRRRRYERSERTPQFSCDKRHNPDTEQFSHVHRQIATKFQA